MDYRIKPCHQLLIASTKFAESVRLRPKYVRDVLGTMAGIELRGKGMGVETISSHGLILD